MNFLREPGSWICNQWFVTRFSGGRGNLTFQKDVKLPNLSARALFKNCKKPVKWPDPCCVQSSTLLQYLSTGDGVKWGCRWGHPVSRLLRGQTQPDYKQPTRIILEGDGRGWRMLRVPGICSPNYLLSLQKYILHWKAARYVRGSKEFQVCIGCFSPPSWGGGARGFFLPLLTT